MPLDGFEQDSNTSEHRHSPRIGSQYAPLILDSHELPCPHLQTPPVQDSPSTLHDVIFSPPHCISIMKYQIHIILGNSQKELLNNIQRFNAVFEKLPFLIQVKLLAHCISSIGL